ncbi:MAG: hypothetical protein E4H07_09670 [Nitrosomonadales bacterium]|nr:MAG: hypothetical protein E4H07_09670 [Nitrosomonadales bacterium]
MAGNRKRNSDLQKAKYKLYEAQEKWKVNKTKKIERHLKKCPADTCAVKALERGFSYGRKPPRSPVWSHSDKATSVLFTEFGRKGSEVLEIKKAKAAKMRKEQEANG